MISIAPYKYRNVFAEDGGPIAMVETMDRPLSGQGTSRAVAYLKDDLFPSFHQSYEEPDGTGLHESPLVARFMAISEAIERWALRESVARGDLAVGAFNLDTSSTGIAAYPGLTAREARKRAIREAVERQCLLAWWEGLLPVEYIPVESGIRAINIQNPYSQDHVVLMWRMVEDRYYSYSFGAGESYEHAIWRTRVELEQIEQVLQYLYFQHPSPDEGVLNSIEDVLYRRVLYYSMPRGFREFLRVLENCPDKVRAPRAKVICDSLIPGPWNRYAKVWRYLLEPPTMAHLSSRYDYFYW